MILDKYCSVQYDKVYCTVLIETMFATAYMAFSVLTVRHIVGDALRRAVQTSVRNAITMLGFLLAYLLE